jgi:hypothetical protein
MRLMILLASLLYAPAAAETSPVAVELFTSQGCSSCPPAEAVMRDLAKRPDLVALEWHVDYWDDLHAGASGKWKDPFSSPDHTRRQRAYNKALRGRPSAYTPQLVIDGRLETVGSHRAEIAQMIEDRQRHDAEAKIAFAPAAESLSVTAAAPAGATVRLVRFANAIVTRVTGGENAGETLAEAHVVRRQEVLGVIGAGGPFTVRFRAPAAGEGCAVLVEDGDGGPILSARYCPK